MCQCVSSMDGLGPLLIKQLPVLSKVFQWGVLMRLWYLSVGSQGLHCTSCYVLVFLNHVNHGLFNIYIYGLYALFDTQFIVTIINAFWSYMFIFHLHHPHHLHLLQ